MYTPKKTKYEPIVFSNASQEPEMDIKRALIADRIKRGLEKQQKYWTYGILGGGALLIVGAFYGITKAIAD